MNKGDENTELNATKELEDPEVTENFYGSIKKMDMSARLFQIFSVPDNEGCRIYRGHVRVAKQDHRGWTCLLQLPLVLKTDIVTVLAYLNCSQCLTMKDPGLITRYQVLRNIKGTKSVALTDQAKKTAMTKIDATQAGSD